MLVNERSHTKDVDALIIKPTTITTTGLHHLSGEGWPGMSKEKWFKTVFITLSAMPLATMQEATLSMSSASPYHPATELSAPATPVLDAPHDVRPGLDIIGRAIRLPPSEHVNFPGRDAAHRTCQ